MTQKVFVLILIIADVLLAAPDKRPKPPSTRARTGPGPPARGGWAGLQTSWRWRALTPFDKRIAGPIGMQDYVPEELKYAYEPYSRHPYYGFR
jgi:hypothetical protein